MDVYEELKVAAIPTEPTTPIPTGPNVWTYAL